MHDPGTRDRWIAGAALVLLVGGVFFAGSRYARPKPAIEIQGLPSPSTLSTAQTGADRPVVRSEDAKSVKVDVEGAVKNPGQETMPPDARVSDAISSAGGKTADADTEPLNLAAKLTDGSQVYVPRKANPTDADNVADNYKGGPSAPSTYSSHPGGGSSGGRGGKHPSGPVSLNTGSESQLESLPGVGPSTAKKILDYRQEHGGFSSIDEVMAVKGIGPKKLKAMRQWLRL